MNKIKVRVSLEDDNLEDDLVVEESTDEVTGATEQEESAKDVGKDTEEEVVEEVVTDGTIEDDVEPESILDQTADDDSKDMLLEETISSGIEQLISITNKTTNLDFIREDVVEDVNTLSNIKSLLETSIQKEDKLNEHTKAIAKEALENITRRLSIESSNIFLNEDDSISIKNIYELIIRIFKSINTSINESKKYFNDYCSISEELIMEVKNLNNSLINRTENLGDKVIVSNVIDENGIAVILDVLNLPDGDVRKLFEVYSNIFINTPDLLIESVKCINNIDDETLTTEVYTNFYKSLINIINKDTEIKESNSIIDLTIEPLIKNGLINIKVSVNEEEGIFKTSITEDSRPKDTTDSLNTLTVDELKDFGGLVSTLIDLMVKSFSKNQDILNLYDSISKLTNIKLQAMSVENIRKELTNEQDTINTYTNIRSLLLFIESLTKLLTINLTTQTFILLLSTCRYMNMSLSKYDIKKEDDLI